MKAKQDGFSTVEALLVLVIVGIVGFTGWFVYHSNKSADATYSSASKISNAPSPKYKAKKKSDNVSKPSTQKNTNQSNNAVATTNSSTIQSKPTPDYNDGNFVALSPNSGLLTNKNLSTFEWTPHRLATSYKVEIKFLGQADYPATTPADQTVTYTSTDIQPSKITLTKNLDDGDYQWRVTAEAVINGVNVDLQSTSSWNYQIHS